MLHPAILRTWNLLLLLKDHVPAPVVNHLVRGRALIATLTILLSSVGATASANNSASHSHFLLDTSVSISRGKFDIHRDILSLRHIAFFGFFE